MTKPNITYFGTNGAQMRDRTARNAQPRAAVAPAPVAPVAKSAPRVGKGSLLKRDQDAAKLAAVKLPVDVAKRDRQAAAAQAAAALPVASKPKRDRFGLRKAAGV